MSCDLSDLAFRDDRVVYDHLRLLFDWGHLHHLLGVLLDSAAEDLAVDWADWLYHSAVDRYYYQESVKTEFR